MDMFSSSPLMESFPSSRFPSPVPSPTRTEVDLPMDVDQSFNSSMSLSDSSPSPFGAPLAASKKLAPTSSGSSNGIFSPSPSVGKVMRRPEPVPIQSAGSLAPLGQPVPPRRAFGRELSLNAPRSFGPNSLSGTKTKSMMLPPAVPDNKTTSSKAPSITIKRTSSEVPQLSFRPAMMRGQTDSNIPSPQRPGVESDMDMDSPFPPHRRASGLQASPALSVASISGSPGLGSFFCDSPSTSALPPAKRRSLVDDSPASPNSPSAKRASYNRNMDKATSTSGMLFGAANIKSGSSSLASRRGGQYKRPTLMSVSHQKLNDDSPRSASAASAYPILYSKPTLASGQPHLAVPAPMRRAYSVCDQGHLGMSTPDTEDDESEYENSPSTTIHAEYARRHGQQFVPRVDGSPGFKPNRRTYTSSCTTSASPSAACKSMSPYGAGGLPGFGDNEMDGKILPCHKVKEDGLVRITPRTVRILVVIQLQGTHTSSTT